MPILGYRALRRATENHSAFDLILTQPPMTILLDGRIATHGTPKTELLLRLAQGPGMRCLHPSDAFNEPIGETFTVVPPGPVGDFMQWTVRVDGPTSLRMTSLHSHGWTPDPELQSRGRAVPARDPDMVHALSDLGDAMRADLVVIATNELPERLASQQPLCTIDQAIALLGLRLRSAGAHDLSTTLSISKRLDLKLSRWIEATCLMPNVHGAVFTLGHASPAVDYLQACRTRMSSMLSARDEALRAALTVATRESHDAVEALESTVLMAIAALDALARAINVGLRLGLSGNQLKLTTNDGLRRGLQTVAPRSAALLGHHDVRAWVTLVSKLRNTVHAEPLGSVQHLDRHPRNTTLASIPSEIAGAVIQAASPLGLQDKWDIREGPNCLMFDPIAATQDLIVWTAQLIDRLCELIPWPGSATAPPILNSNPASVWFEDDVARNRMLFGTSLWANPIPEIFDEADPVVG